MDTNPFFEPWTTPFGMPPFDRIRAEHIPAALDRGMQEQLAEVAGITANPEAPSFANTIEVLERSGALLERVSNVFSNLVASLGTGELEQIELDYAPKLAQHGMRIALDPALFARIDVLYQGRHELGLAPDALRLLERRHLGFIRAGAHLAEPAKARMAEISTRLATLHARFGQNVVHDEKEWFLPLGEADLAGLPDFLREGARAAAAERGLDGHVVTLARASIEPFLTFSTRRDLRRTAYLAWVARGEHPGAHDNRVLIPEILALRAERARLLGYRSYVEFRLADTMAGSQANVQRLMDEVWAAAKRRAAAERDRWMEVARTDGINDRIEPWDWLHYAERVRQEAYAIDEAELKPYFVLENIQQAAFDTASRLFGLRFIERPDLPRYHPDVRAWEVQDANGHVGVFLADNHARPGKRSGAWMSSFRDQSALDAAVSPIVVNNNNFARGTPTLLSYDDAETLFHEFGHALHGLLSRVRYPSQSGTAVRRDFVEFPSQIYEHWLAVPQTLQRYARHHESGEPLPEALMQRLLAARTFNQGFATVEYTASAILDMALHAHPDPAGLDVTAFEREVLAGIGMPPEIGPRHRPAHFQHLFAGSGYAAGYYSYLWAEVLDADGFGCFEAAGDPFDPQLASGLRRILEAGDTQDPMALYVAFRGQEPRTEALLRHRGLLAMAEG
ncbi:Dipeptidyl carboxypeptidase [Rhodovastum atsumiense]|uniref:M3 family metallopeptidase n=1 Tax=Rhodovastum atsumiense TaxID=504468 RepID=A0A5M6IWL6_9PROT|nr:M3 family metallopeptidase [Rhodovastum atsumiense]KAA5612621.1 M3 family metallopeptidase [Rhodovastum atsumiense]CAH2601278.1 Dipeptidyl carboxypeptidase [Rhodovastum atsumiense]